MQENYALGYRQAEQQRLQQQAVQLGSESARLFDEIGVAEGQHVLELGCGPRGCLDLLRARVGRTGAVVGVELSPESVGLAQAHVAEQGFENVEVLCADAGDTGLRPASFDLVTSRLVLVNIPAPERIIAEAVALARDGGAVAFHEVDFVAMVCDPPCPAWTDLLDLYLAVADNNGNDYHLGRRLPRMLRQAGLTDVRVTPIMHTHPIGDPRRHLLLDFAGNFKPAVLTQRLCSEIAYDQLTTALATHLEDPDTTVFLGPYVQAWGRKPGHAGP